MDKLLSSEILSHPALRQLLPHAKKWAILGPAGYLLLVAVLRKRRLRQLYKDYNYTSRKDLAKMTDDEAYRILKTIVQLEFPRMFLMALQFALFRTYGIPTISRLLVKTSEFSDKEKALKRYADTSVLIAEFTVHPPASLRARKGIARMNYLHHGYRQSGKILDDDMLYTLSLFALEPVRWVERYEWRKLSDLEKCAMGTFWKSMGDAMEISFEKLPSSRTGWRDGLHFWEELDAWSRAYEEGKMIPDENNKITADATVNVLLWDIPKPLHPVGRQMVYWLMDERLRNAMMYPQPNFVSRLIFPSIFFIRKLALRYLFLPRPYFMRFNRLTGGENDPGPHFIKEWEGAPYYVKPSLWKRWRPSSWYTWIRGRPLPGDEGDKYYPGGYYTENVGPKNFEGKGQAYMEQTKARLQRERTGGCPFHVPKLADN
ncbi:hypothetical protein VTO42DRAFT_8992 [Malbranchea cinnamomea]